jgi:1-acyl-sn-glycerol-3-phosphate acyltransferase
MEMIHLKSYQKWTWKITQNTFCRYLYQKYQVDFRHFDKEPESPYILVANHAHLLDPWIIGGKFKRPVSYLANVEGVSRLSKFLSSLYGVIPKKKGVPDSESMRLLLKNIRNGESIGIFVEGDRSWDGETADMIENIPGLIKKLNVPVFCVRLQGNYLAHPRWADHPRKGRISVESSILPSDSIAAMTAPEIERWIREHLYRNEIKDLNHENRQFTGKNTAGGIQRLLWLCPVCSSHDTLTGQNHTVLCRACHNCWTVNANLQVNPVTRGIADLKDWNDFQQTQVKTLTASPAPDCAITRTEGIEWKPDIYDQKCSPVDADLLLYRDRVQLSDRSGNQILTMPVREILFMVDNFNREFLFTFRKMRNRIRFHGRNALKWIQLISELQKNTGAI